jgi:uncharacterized RDD family membrane protein YckC
MAMEPIGDQLNIDTPELVSIELPLAGIGSRFIAILVDTLILIGVGILLIILAVYTISALDAYGGKAATWGLGVFILIGFLLFWGYFALFEAFNNGRTPGKRVAKIRWDATSCGTSTICRAFTASALWPCSSAVGTSASAT